jgi:hypothetical protein
MCPQEEILVAFYRVFIIMDFRIDFYTFQNNPTPLYYCTLCHNSNQIDIVVCFKFSLFLRNIYFVWALKADIIFIFPFLFTKG